MKFIWACLFINLAVVYETHVNLAYRQHIIPVKVGYVFVDYMHIDIHTVAVVIIMVTLYWKLIQPWDKNSCNLKTENNNNKPKQAIYTYIFIHL